MNPKKHSALLCLIQGMSQAETAQQLDVRPNTISRWLADPEFAEQLHLFQQKALEVASAALTAKYPEAIECLYDSMNDNENPPSVRVNAAKALIDRGLRAADLSARLRHQELEWLRKMTLQAEKDAHDREFQRLFGTEPQYRDWTEAASFLRKRGANGAYWGDYRAKRDKPDRDDDYDDNHGDGSLGELIEALSEGSVDSPVNNSADDQPANNPDEDYLARWRDKIVRTENADPADLLNNPNNWQLPPNTKIEVGNASFNDTVRSRPIIVIETSGHIVDGHKHVQQALHAGQQTVTVAYVRLSQEEEEQVLADLTPNDDDQNDDHID